MASDEQTSIDRETTNYSLVLDRRDICKHVVVEMHLVANYRSRAD